MAEHRLRGTPGAGRLDAWLASELPLSRSRVQSLINDGHVLIDGVVAAKPRMKLRGGEDILVRVPAPPPSGLVAQDIPVPLVHVDPHVVVVDKPAGLVVHPAPGHPDGTLVNALLHLLADAVPADGTVRGHAVDPSRPGIVHRLDMGTSGVMLAARTPSAHAHLAEQFVAHTVVRRYLTLVHGRFKTDSGTVDEPLGRHPNDRRRQAVREAGRRAVTHWRVLAEADTSPDPAGHVLSLVECRLETGRTHQIRVHMHHLNHPVVGDPLYCGRRRHRAVRAAAPELDHQLLHAGVLGFVHPASGDVLRFQRPPPADFLAVADALGLADVVARWSPR